MLLKIISTHPGDTKFRQQLGCLSSEALEMFQTSKSFEEFDEKMNLMISNIQLGRCSVDERRGCHSSLGLKA